MTTNAAHATGMTFRGDGHKTVFNNCSFNATAGVPATAKQGDAGSAAAVPTSQDAAIGAAQRASAHEPQPESVSFQNGVWINLCTSDIISVFGIDEDVLNTIQKRLETSSHKCIFPVRGKITVPIDGELTAGFACKLPPGLVIKSCTTNPLLLNRSRLRNEAHSMYFESTLNIQEDSCAKSCKALYHANVKKNGEICDEIEAMLAFSWPKTNELATGGGEQASASNFPEFHDGNSHDDGNVRIGCHSKQIDSRHETCSSGANSPTRQSTRTDQDHSEYVKHIATTIDEFLAWVNSKNEKVGVSGGFTELDGCGVRLAPDLVKKSTEVKISVAASSHLPEPPSAAVSHALKCQPSNLPLRIKLKSFLHPKEGTALTLILMAKKSDESWKEICTLTLVDGNVIECDVPHFCWYMAVVSEEEEKNGEYYLFNDVWMDLKSRNIVSLFCKDKISFKKASKAFEDGHTHILPVPEELTVGIGDTVKVDFDGPRGLKIESIDGTNSQIAITHESMKKGYFALFFRQTWQLSDVNPEKQSKLFYSASVLDADNKFNGEGCSVPLNLPYAMASPRSESRS